MTKLALLLSVSLLAACGSSSPCDGAKGSCKSFSAGAKESDIAAAFASATTGSTIAFGAGTYSFTNSLNLAVATGVTVKGAGLDKTILDFAGQVAGSEGLYIADHSDGVALQDFTVKDTKGDAVKI